MRELLGLAMMLLTTGGAANRRTITGMTYIEAYDVGATVKVYRGVAAAIEVKGQFLDLSTGVEVTTTSGSAVAGFAPIIARRTGGQNTSIVINLVPPTNADLGTYQVRIHYTAEVNGPDRFTIRVFDHGVVNGLHISEPAESGGAYVAGREYTLVATGDRLANAAFDITKTGIKGMKVLPPLVAATASQATFRVRFDSSGIFTIPSNALYDGNLNPTPPAAACPIYCYGGTTTLQFQVVFRPTVTAVSPRTPAPGTVVTVSGASLNVPGFSRTVNAKPRYGATTGTIFSSVVPGGLELTVPATGNMRSDSISIDYAPTSVGINAAQAFSILLPPIAVQGGQPTVVLLDSIGGGASTPRKLLFTGTRNLRGKFLAPNPLPPELVLAPGITPPVFTTPRPITPISVANLPAPASPTLTFRSASLAVVTSRYDRSSSLPNGEQGADLVSFSVPSFPDTISGDFVATTPSGSVTLHNVFYLPAPRATSLRRQLPGGQSLLVTDGTLLKNSSYEITGTGLIVTTAGVVALTAGVSINGAPVTVTSTGTLPDGHLIFTVPSTATTGPLTLSTVAGSTTMGTFTVSTAPAALTIAGAQVSPTDVVGGQTVTVTVAMNGTVSPGTTAGNLVFTRISGDTSLIAVPGPVAIATNPVIVHLGTRVTTTNQTLGLRVTNEAGAGTTFSLVLRPPSPTAVTLQPAALAGGQTSQATVSMTGGAVSANNVVVSLTSSDPTTATVPASVVLNGDVARFAVSTAVVPVARTVTITASSGGQSRSATLTVAPPTVASVVTNPVGSVITPQQSIPVAVTLTAPIPAPLSATVSCVGEGLTCPTTVSLSGTTGSFTVNASDVPTARTATINVTFNGATQSTSLELRPLDIKTMTLSPATVGAGSPSSVTLQLNRPAGLTLQLSSSDPAVAVPVGQVTLTTQDITKLVSITTLRPQTASKTVTITATGTRQTPFGPATVTRSVTLTVVP